MLFEPFVIKLNRMKNSPLFNVFKRELWRIADSRTLQFAAVAGPIISFLIIALTFSSGVVNNLPVAIVDNDNSQFSRKVMQLIDASPVAKVQCFSDINEAYRQMKQGSIGAIVELPANLERDIVKMQTPDIALFINNANVIKGGLLYSGIYKTLATINGGVKINISMKQGLTYSQALDNVQPVGVDTHLLFNPYGNYSYYLTLSLLPLMVVVFAFFVTVYALGKELKTGTAGELMRVSHNSVMVAVTGKTLPYTIILFLNMVLMNLILFRVLGTPLNGTLVVLLFSEFLIIVVYQLVAIALLGLTSNMRLTLSLGSAYTLMAMTFAGITFPTFAMPQVAKIFSWLFPYTFWIKIFTGETIKNRPLFTSVPEFMVLLMFILISLLMLKPLKRKLTNSKYWGRS